MSDASPLRIIFAGTPEFAATHLLGILDAGEHQVIAVYSQPDRPAGRGKKLTPSPVKNLAQKHDIPVYQPQSLKNADAQAQLQSLNADLMVVVAYGLLLPKAVLEAPRLGCINVHASLLPRWRGAAPIQRAIEAGDRESGVIIMQMDEGLDTGDMLLEARCDISSIETGGSLHDKLANIGVPALNKALNLLSSGNAITKKQDDASSCYAPKISKVDAIIDWLKPADVIERQIRAFNPFPIAYASLAQQRIKIWQVEAEGAVNQQHKPGTIIRADKSAIVVSCGNGSLALKHIQLPGKKAMDVAAVLNSKASLFAVGAQFDCQLENNKANSP
jgi:methionyl-tRNA formyltransferase